MVERDGVDFRYWMCSGARRNRAGRRAVPVSASGEASLFRSDEMALRLRPVFWGSDVDLGFQRNVVAGAVAVDTAG